MVLCHTKIKVKIIVEIVVLKLRKSQKNIDLDKTHEQILIRAEIGALNLIEKHLNNLKMQSDFSIEEDFDLAIFHAENEAEQNVNYDIKFSAQNNVPSISNHTVQWFMENTGLDYNMYVEKKENIKEVGCNGVNGGLPETSNKNKANGLPNRYIL